MHAPPLTESQNASLPHARHQPGFDSRELMRGTREVLIHHGDQVYRLRHTRNDKLILVK